MSSWQTPKDPGLIDRELLRALQLLEEELEKLAQLNREKLRRMEKLRDLDNNE